MIRKSVQRFSDKIMRQHGLIYDLLAKQTLIWNRPRCARAPAIQGAMAMASTTERRKGDRVTFERGIPAHMMGIDGTWRRDCTMEDVSETGAKLTIEGSVEGLHLKEFFLLLSSTGLAYRRCELAWVNGDQIGVTFLKQGDKKKKAAGAPARMPEWPRTPSYSRHLRATMASQQLSCPNRRAMIGEPRYHRDVLKCPSSPPKPWSSPQVSACACGR